MAPALYINVLLVLAIYDMFCEYCTAKNIFFTNISDFPSNIRHYIAEQSKRYLENDSIFIFFKILDSLRVENKLHKINTSKITNDTQKQIFYMTIITFGLKALMFLLKSNLHAKMKAFRLIYLGKNFTKN